MWVLALRIPNGYGYGYEADIYSAGRVRGSYYPYPTRPVNIPNCNHKATINIVYMLNYSIITSNWNFDPLVW